MVAFQAAAMTPGCQLTPSTAHDSSCPLFARCTGIASCSYTTLPSVARHHSGVEAGPRRVLSRRGPRSSERRLAPLRATAADQPEDGADPLAAAFQRELSSRSSEAVVEEFNGKALLALLQERYGRSYDVSLVQRRYLGKVFIALNIMWKYREQQSFTLTEEEYMERLDGVAAALVAWGMAAHVKSEVLARKDRPRVGKAVSIMLDLEESVWAEWFLA